MINIIWIIIVIVSIIYGIISNRIENINSGIISSGKESVKILIDYFASITFWSGILGVAEKSGLLRFFAYFFRFLIKPFFKNVKNKETVDLITMNFVANFFGMGSAATPIGLKAIEKLQEENVNKEEASNEMVTLVMLNTTCFCIISTSIISIRKYNNAKITVEILPYIFFVSLLTTIFGLIFNKILRKKRI